MLLGGGASQCVSTGREVVDRLGSLFFGGRWPRFLIKEPKHRFFQDSHGHPLGSRESDCKESNGRVLEIFRKPRLLALSVAYTGC